MSAWNVADMSHFADVITVVRNLYSSAVSLLLVSILAATVFEVNSHMRCLLWQVNDINRRANTLHDICLNVSTTLRALWKRSADHMCTDNVVKGERSLFARQACVVLILNTDTTSIKSTNVCLFTAQTCMHFSSAAASAVFSYTFTTHMEYNRYAKFRRSE